MTKQLVPIVTAVLLMTVLVGCGGSAEEQTPSASATTSPAPSPTAPTPASPAAPDAPTPTTDERPTAIPAEDAYLGQLGELAVVVVAVAQDESEEEALAAVRERVEGLGYEIRWSPIQCFPGPWDELGADPSGEPTGSGLGLYFATRAEADTFAQLYGEPVEAIQVGEVGCGFM